MNLDSINWAGIGIALIGVISAWLSGRSANKAAKFTSGASVLNARTVAETEAYGRARKLDTETIQRQDEELDELREENKLLKMQVRQLTIREIELSEENVNLRRRVARLERYFGKQHE